MAGGYPDSDLDEQTLVKVRWLTGHEALDGEGLPQDGDYQTYQFDSKQEAEAFAKGITLALSFGDGWQDANAEVEIL